MSAPWLSLRAIRSKGYASGLPDGACRRIGRGCIRGRKSVEGGCGGWCGSRGELSGLSCGHQKTPGRAPCDAKPGCESSREIKQFRQPEWGPAAADDA